MIPTQVREGAVVENITGETRAFTINATGKAFRTLIDGLYSNKVRAVIRELCSNAQDSHIEAGQDRPFTVAIPTNLDPTFRVRDYGTSLSHDDVMGLYTSLFSSTRDDTNEATGMLGLGSKSPFAYTDSFCVTAYMDGVKRLYLAHLGQDGVPSLTHVSSDPCDEPQGLEVSFAVKRGDHYSFQDEMQYVAMGYTTLPEVLGMQIHIPEARMRGENWAIFPSDFRAGLHGRTFVRQGSVLYPCDMEFPDVPYPWVTVTEIPIGTAEVAASREALAYDERTRLAIREIQRTALVELKAQIMEVVAAATTRFDKAQVYGEYNGIVSALRGSTKVSLRKNPDGHDSTLQPGEVLERAIHFGKGQLNRGSYDRRITSMEYNEIASLKLLVNNGDEKLVRRTKRIRNFGGYSRNNNAYVLDVHDPAMRAEAVAWVKECFQLSDEQITYAADLPDDPPVKRAGVSATGRRELGANQLWMSRQEGCIVSAVYGYSAKGYGEWPQQMRNAAKAIGFDLHTADIFFVTERQEESMTKRKALPESRKLDNYIAKKLKKSVSMKELNTAVAYDLVASTVGHWNAALPVVLAEFFPEIPATTKNTFANTKNVAELAKISLQDLPITATITARLKELVDQFPLLFQRSDHKHYQQYVTAMKVAQKEEVQS